MSRDVTKPGCACESAEDFIHLLGHDVRNCLRAIRDVPTWIEEDLDEMGVGTSTPLSENVKMLKTQASRLDRLLADLMVLSRVGWHSSPSITSWREIFDHVKPEFAGDLEHINHHALGDFKIAISSQDARTALMALLTNAFVHGQAKENGVTLSTRSWDKTVQLCVEDKGPGISSDFLSRAFDPLAKADPRDQVEGSGLGLTMVQKVARSARGRASITNASTGAKVELTIPLAE